MEFARQCIVKTVQDAIRIYRHVADKKAYEFLYVTNFDCLREAIESVKAQQEGQDDEGIGPDIQNLTLLTRKMEAMLMKYTQKFIGFRSDMRDMKQLS